MSDKFKSPKTTVYMLLMGMKAGGRIQVEAADQLDMALEEAFAQLELELEWRRREMDRAMDAMFDGNYQWQEDDAKSMGQLIEGIVETLKAIVV